MSKTKANDVLQFNNMQIASKDLRTLHEVYDRAPVPQQREVSMLPGHHGPRSGRRMPPKRQCGDQEDRRQGRRRDRRSKRHLRPRIPFFSGHTLYVKDGKVSYVHNLSLMEPINFWTRVAACRRGHHRSGSHQETIRPIKRSPRASNIVCVDEPACDTGARQADVHRRPSRTKPVRSTRSWTRGDAG